MIRWRKRQRGMALVLTLMAVSFLVALTVQLIASVDRQMESAANLRDSVQLDAMVASGRDLALACLMADLEENDFDGPQDSWRNLDEEKVGALAGGIKLAISVRDLSGSLQLNGLVAKKTAIANKQRQMWKRFLLSERFALENSDEVDEILDSIQDWLDTDDKTRDDGAETDYYRGQKPPYVSRNGPMAGVDELLYVRGMSKALLYGDEEHEGLAPYLSVVGESGAININTAPIPVLMALNEQITEEIAQELVDFREDKGNSKALASTGWYRQVGGFPGDITLDKDLITVKSEAFQISIEATYNDLTRSGSGIVTRDTSGITLVSWSVD